MPKLVPCPSCDRHVKRVESRCPHCGAAMRDATGHRIRAAGAVVLGLAAATGAVACESANHYGAGATAGGATPMPGVGGAGGAPGLGGFEPNAGGGGSSDGGSGGRSIGGGGGQSVGGTGGEEAP